MKLQCVGGPMDGAVYLLSASDVNRTVSRKPDGLWFNTQDEHGRNVQQQYRKTDVMYFDADGGVVQYVYDGVVVETGIEFETEVSSNP